MTDPFEKPSGEATPPVPAGESTPPVPAGYGAPPVPGHGQPPYPTGPGPVGKVRGTGLTIFLFFITFGIWGLVWFYLVHDEMKQHKGTGLGGVLALVIDVIVGVVMPFLTSMEVGETYERAGRPKPVTALTGLWFFPGMFILVGPFVWFIKTNGALNDYWRSLGATG